MYGSLTNSSRTLPAGSPLYNEVGTGDFDGDGTADVLFRSTVNDDIGFYRVRYGELQTGKQSWHDMGSVPLGFSVVGVGDFTVSGVASALLRNNSTGDLAFLESQGYLQEIQDAQPALDPAFNPAFTVAGVGDLPHRNSNGCLSSNSRHSFGQNLARHRSPDDSNEVVIRAEVLRCSHPENSLFS